MPRRRKIVLSLLLCRTFVDSSKNLLTSHITDALYIFEHDFIQHTCQLFIPCAIKLLVRSQSDEPCRFPATMVFISNLEKIVPGEGLVIEWIGTLCFGWEDKNKPHGPQARIQGASSFLQKRKRNCPLQFPSHLTQVAISGVVFSESMHLSSFWVHRIPPFIHSKHFSCGGLAHLNQQRTNATQDLGKLCFFIHQYETSFRNPRRETESLACAGGENRTTEAAFARNFKSNLQHKSSRRELPTDAFPYNSQLPYWEHRSLFSCFALKTTNKQTNKQTTAIPPFYEFSACCVCRFCRSARFPRCFHFWNPPAKPLRSFKQNFGTRVLFGDRPRQGVWWDTRWYFAISHNWRTELHTFWGD